MRVLFDRTIFSLQRCGGISRYFCELMSALPHQGVESLMTPGLHINSHLLSMRSFAQGWVPDWPYTARIRNGMNRGCERLAFRTKDFDVLHRTFYECRTRSRKPQVVTVYDMISEIYPGYQDMSARKRISCQRADRIIAISKQTKVDLLSLFPIDERKIEVVPLGCTGFAFDGNDNTSIPGPFLLYVGNRSGYKNFNRLIEAFSKAAHLKKSFRLICFGGGAFTSKESLLLHREGLADIVSQMSGADHDLSRLYRQAVALIFPSEYEGFGLPLLEAMSVGCPVLCSSTGALVEVAGEAAIYFDPVKTESIAAVLERTLFDPDQLSAMALAGAERVGLFSWHTCAERTAAVYASVA